MPFSLDSLVTSVKSGFATAQTTFNNFVNDSRAPDTARPRISSTDPTSVIDAPTNTGILSFPHDRPKYYITFAFEEYRRPNQFESLSRTGLKDYICLPLPNNLQDRNNLQYNPEKGNFLVESGSKAVQDISDALKTGTVDGLGGTLISDAAGMAGGFAINRGIGTARALESLGNDAGLGTAGITTGALQNLGLAENPFSTVAFSGPTFKQHQFSWRLAARTQEESVTIKKITDTFKKAAHPEILAAIAGGFYKYPMIVWPKFQPDAAMQNLYQFKPCVIVDINMNYTPNDRPGFFQDSAPIEVIVELHLMEIELWRNGSEGLGGITGIGTSAGDFSNVQSPLARDLGAI